MDTAQPGPPWEDGGWQDHFLNAERHNPAGCFFKLPDTPSEVETATVSSRSTGIIFPTEKPPWGQQKFTALQP